MRTLLVLALALLLPACSDVPFAPHDPARELVGTYRAESFDGYPVPHHSHPLLGAVLELHADGTFSEWWTLVSDTHEFHGRWRLIGGEVEFTMDGRFLERAYIDGRRLELAESGVVYVRDRVYR